MMRRHGVSRAVFAMVVLAGATCIGQEREARRRFQVEVEVDRFLESVAGQVDRWLEGYAGEPEGQERPRPSHLSFTDRLLRPHTPEGQKTISIAWSTVPVPEGFKDKTATFMWVAGIAPSYGPRSFDIHVDGRKRFVVRSVPEESWAVAGADGGRMLFNALWTDDRGCRFGYMRLEAPAAWLKPAKPLRIRIAGRREDFKSWPRIFQHTDTVSWFRTRPRRSVFSSWAVGVSEAEPITLKVVSRPEWTHRWVEICRGQEVLGQAMLQPADGISVARVKVPVDDPETLEQSLAIKVDGKEEGRTSPVPLVLLNRWRRVAGQVRLGKVPAEQRREAAMVLARGDLLAGSLSRDDARFEDIKRRAASVREAREALTAALADFEAEGDSYAGRRGGFHAAYISSVDNSGQIYSLYVPPGYDPEKRYALVVGLHGAGGWYGNPRSPDKPLDHFEAGCDGRGQNGYTGLGELDVLEVVRDVCARYNIDRDRICLTGGSMGGGGTWRLCARYPDLFAAAAPEFGWAAGLYLENLANLPVWDYHDDADFSVPVDCSRVAVGYLADLGYPVIYTETSGGGHSRLKIDPAWGIGAWMRRQRRDPHPRFVHYTTATPNRGRAYWLQILEFTDPNRPAAVRARVRNVQGRNQVFLHLENVEVLAMDLPAALLPPGRDVSVSADGVPLTVKGPLPRRVFIHRTGAEGARGAYAVKRKDPRQAKPYRPYVVGGLNSMYTTGEPLMIVKGTGGNDEKLLEAIDGFCRMLSYRATSWSAMPVGRIPVKADADVTEEDVRRCNLILVGPASANRLLARITGRLPAVEKDAVLTVGGERYDLHGRGYGLFYYNPESPKRLIVVMSAPEAGKFYADVWNGVADRIHDERPFGLVINDETPRRNVRQIMWEEGWRVAAGAFDNERLPGAFATEGSAAELEAAALRRATGAELALYRMPAEPEQPRWDVTRARWHDLRADMGPPREVYTSVLAGAEIIAALKASGEKKVRLTTWLAVPIDRLDPTAEYRICMDQRVLGTFVRTSRKNLPRIELVRVDRYARMRRAAGLRRRPRPASAPATRPGHRP